jgi:hypothetical protein
VQSLTFLYLHHFQTQKGIPQMDMKEILELLIVSMDKFGSVVTLVMFALVGIFVYLMRNKTKTEKVLTTTLEQMNKNNAESVKMTAENITEIKATMRSVLDSTKELNGEIRGIVQLIQFLIADFQRNNNDKNNNEGDDE